MLKFELPNKERPFEVIFVCFVMGKRPSSVRPLAFHI